MLNQTQFDERIFPYRFECTDCPYDSATEVSREEAEEAVPPGIEATPNQAVDAALVRKGWHRTRGGLICERCLEDLD